MPETPSRMLEAGLASFNISASEDQIARLMNYLDLIQRWNKIDNLTAVDHLNEMVSVHLLDSLSLLTELGDSLLDVGSGAGLPGIPLAILKPGTKITLLDASAKRVRFLHQAIAALELQNTEAVHSRLDKFQPQGSFDLIVSRAFSSLKDFVPDAVHLLSAKGKVVAMKGKYPEDELAALGDQFKYTVNPITVPGLDAQRHLVTITQT